METVEKLVWHMVLVNAFLQSVAEFPGEGGTRVTHGIGICMDLAWFRLSRGDSR